MLTAADHFGHRETDDIVVDPFWNREISMTNSASRSRTRATELASISLDATTGREALQAFYHPFAALGQRICRDHLY